MKTKTQRVLSIMHVMAWIVFVGLCIQAGGTLCSFIVSLINPAAVKHMYMQLNLSGLDQYDHGAYITVVTLMVCITAAKAFITYLTMMIFMKINLANPFSDEVAALVQRISIVAFVTGLFAIVASSYSDWLIKKGISIPFSWAAGELLLLAGVVFVIAQVFKRGMELQAENDLTV